MKWTKDFRKNDVAEGLIGNGYNSSNAHEIDLGQSINGSGSHCFGGAKTWPRLKVIVSFQAGEEKQMKSLAVKVKKLIAEHFAEMKEQGLR